MKHAYDVGENVIRLSVRSGQILDLRRLTNDEIRLNDIAHSLSHLCRFAGHCPTFYSVAQHSVIVAGLVPKRLRLQALLHDASEAYLVDVPHFIKHSPELAGYRALEDRIQQFIYARFYLDSDMAEDVKVADRTVTDLEWRQMMRNEHVESPIVPQSSEDARRAFLDAYHQFRYDDSFGNL